MARTETWTITLNVIIRVDGPDHEDAMADAENEVHLALGRDGIVVVDVQAIDSEAYE